MKSKPWLAYMVISENAGELDSMYRKEIHIINPILTVVAKHLPIKKDCVLSLGLFGFDEETNEYAVKMYLALPDGGRSFVNEIVLRVSRPDIGVAAGFSFLMELRDEGEHAIELEAEGEALGRSRFYVKQGGRNGGE